MYICQWSLEIVFGKQKQALDIMKLFSVVRASAGRAIIFFLLNNIILCKKECVKHQLQDKQQNGFHDKNFVK
jgi:hypothetical protein